jgi:hypothetical protein
LLCRPKKRKRAALRRKESNAAGNTYALTFTYYRSCLGIISLLRSYGPERIEAAAKRGNDIGATNCGSIKSILEKGLDKAYAPSTATDARPIQHANIRGRGYYN